MYNDLEKDLEIFKENLKQWQEKYMEKLIKKYISIMNANIPASTKFWELERRIKDDKKHPGVDPNHEGFGATSMIYYLAVLMSEGVIEVKELDDFSEEIKTRVILLQSYFFNTVDKEYDPDEEWCSNFL